MGWLLQTKSIPHFAITFSETMAPANPDPDIYEVVEAASMVKPQAQLDAESAALALALQTLFEEAINGSTAMGVMLRTLALTGGDHDNRISNALTALVTRISTATGFADVKAWAIAHKDDLPPLQPAGIKQDHIDKANSGLAD